MATSRQIEANRINAIKSTGPKTAEGKARSRLNATTHGLAGELGTLEARLAEEFTARRDEWNAQYQPATDEAHFSLDLLVASSIRIDLCDRSLNALIARESARAEVAWDADRRLEAAEVASGLAKNPMVVSLRLESNRHGCALKIRLWDRLGEAATDGRPWTDAETSLALDLLGIPRDLRDGSTPLDPRKGVAILEHRRELAARELDRLQRLEAALAPFDDLERRQAEAGNAALLSAPAKLLMRYERDAFRRFHAASRALRQSAAEPPAPQPVAPPKPAPPPIPDVEPRRTAIPTPPLDLDLDDILPPSRSSYINISALRSTPLRN
jgi:hypothetical protein